MMENTITELKKYEKLLVFVFFVCLTYVYLGANVFNGEIFAPTDMLFDPTHPGFLESGVSVPVNNPERSDITSGLLPSWIFIRNEVINNHHLPLWYPLSSGGAPTGAPGVPVTTKFFTVDFLSFFIFGNGFGITLGVILKLVIVGFGVYLLCRKWLTMLPSIFAGITLMMSGTIAVWIHTPTILVIGWIPWLIWSIIRVFEKPTGVRLIVVALITPMVILGAFPYLVILGLGLGFLFSCWMLFTRYRNKEKNVGRAFVYACLGIFLGVLVASAYTVPFMEWYNHSNVSGRFGYSPLSFGDIDILWEPFKYTDIVNDHHSVPSTELTGYVGLLAVFLVPFAIGGLFFNRRKILSSTPILFWLSIFALALVITFNIMPLSSYLYQLFPFNTNPNNRTIGIVVLGIAVLSGFGLQQVIRGVKNLCAKLKIENHRGMLIVFVLASTIIFIQIIDISVVSRSANAAVPADTFYPATSTIEYVKQNLLPGQNVIATNAYTFSGTLGAYNIPDWFALGGYLSPETKKILNDMVTNAFTPTSVATLFGAGSVNLDSKYMDALFVKYVLVSIWQIQDIKKIPDTWEKITKGPNIIILENKMVPPGAYIIPEGGNLEDFNRDSIITKNIQVSRINSDHMKYVITDNKPGTLVVPIRVWVGWKAYVNDQPTEIKPYLGTLSSVNVPPNAIVEFKYEPSSYWSGIILSVIALAILFSIFLYQYKHSSIVKKILSQFRK